MNIALEKTQEFVNGVKRREYGDAFVRGNNGELLTGHGYECLLIYGSHVHLCRLMNNEYKIMISCSTLFIGDLLTNYSRDVQA